MRKRLRGRRGVKSACTSDACDSVTGALTHAATAAGTPILVARASAAANAGRTAARGCSQPLGSACGGDNVCLPSAYAAQARTSAASSARTATHVTAPSYVTAQASAIRHASGQTNRLAAERRAVSASLRHAFMLRVVTEEVDGEERNEARRLGAASLLKLNTAWLTERKRKSSRKHLKSLAWPTPF